jgi:predicted RNA-binding Zn ribbon-like protein
MFTHDSQVALQAAAVLVNTMPGELPGDDSPDTLTTIDQLAELIERIGWTGEFRRDDHELQAVRAVRSRLRPLWEEDEAHVAGLVNRLLFEARAVPQLVDHDGIGWHIHAARSDAPLAERMAVEAAMALIDVLRVGELDRLRVCDGQHCDDVIVDVSRNRCRRFCDSGCAARAHSAAYRARLSAGE